MTCHTSICFWVLSWVLRRDYHHSWQKVLHPEDSKTKKTLKKSQHLTKIGWSLCFSTVLRSCCFCHTEKQDLLKAWGSCSASSILLIFKLPSTSTTHIGRWFTIYVLHLNYQQTTSLSQLPGPSACLRHAPNCLHGCTSLCCLSCVLHMLEKVANVHWLLSERTHGSAES